MRAFSSHLMVFLIGVILATAAGAAAHPAEQPSLTTRVKRLEIRQDLLQSRYQTFCNTLKHNTLKFQDSQVRSMFMRMSATCWSR